MFHLVQFVFYVKSFFFLFFSIFEDAQFSFLKDFLFFKNLLDCFFKFVLEFEFIKSCVCALILCIARNSFCFLERNVFFFLHVNKIF